MATKLVTLFDQDCVLDVDQIHAHVSSIYNLGYTGLYKVNGHLAVYIQSSDKRYRLAPGKMKNICAQFGDIRGVQKYAHRIGTLVHEVGHFRKHGKESAHGATNEINIIGDNNTVHNVNNIDNSVTACTSALPKKRTHTSTGQSELSEEDDPVFVPVYTGFGGDWKVVSWNRATKKAKRQACTKFRERVLELQEHMCNYCRCSVSFGEYSNADMDHIVPLNAGGEQALSNVHVLCTPCHRRKTAMESRRLTTTLGGIMSVAFRPSETQSAGAESAE